MAKALWIAGGAVLVAAALGAGLVADRAGDGRRPDQAVTAPGTPAATVSVAMPPAPAAVLPSAAVRPLLSIPALRGHVSDALADPGLGRRTGFAVAQLGHPGDQWSYGAATVTPASTLKLLTTTAALDVLGPRHRFTTSVRAGQGDRSIVLVGGGDPLLTDSAPHAGDDAPYPQQATLEQLAQDTAARLLGEQITRVRLGYDTSLFTGPAVNPAWPATYIPENVVSPISPLWIDEGRENPGLAQRSPDPALAAAEAFRAELRRLGIAVVGPLAETTPRPGSAARIAAESSAPLQQIVQHILEQSDNEGAEVLLRQVAVAEGEPGSFAGGVTAVRAVLARLGLDLSGASFSDGSGLSREDRLPVSLLLDVLELDASPGQPRLRGVITGLPVAGFSGSLGYRFEQDAGIGRGYVRAKTGTLTGVHALAGLAATRDGRTLVFVAIADRVPVPKTLDARADLDVIAARLSTCGC